MNGRMRRASSSRRTLSPSFSIGVRQRFVKSCWVAEETRQQEVELRPQFAEMILERRASQAQTMPRAAGSRIARGALVVAFLTYCASSRISRW